MINNLTKFLKDLEASLKAGGRDGEFDILIRWNLTDSVVEIREIKSDRPNLLICRFISRTEIEFSSIDIASYHLARAQEQIQQWLDSGCPDVGGS